MIRVTTCTPSRSRLNHELALPLAEHIRELSRVVLLDDVVEPWLTTVLVDSLRDLVTCSISKTREERQELASKRSRGMLSEDDGRE